MLFFQNMPLCEYDWWFRAGFEYPSCLAFALIAIFIFGSCWGSFMNVCIWRMPRRESVVTAPSHCTACGADIRWYDNLPVISYIVLRGKCRACHTHYSCRYFIVEVIMGLLFCGVFIKAGLSQHHRSNFTTRRGMKKQLPSRMLWKRSSDLCPRSFRRWAGTATSLKPC